MIGGGGAIALLVRHRAHGSDLRGITLLHAAGWAAVVLAPVVLAPVVLAAVVLNDGGLSVPAAGLQGTGTLARQYRAQEGRDEPEG